ncbi:MAG: DUF4982 domain-containing protein [Bacteroidaceae bacterium]|nr:DUF4982 domain-containing protein [Bacteroidaceae bacterium]
MKLLTLAVLFACAIPSIAQRAINFNSDWLIAATSITEEKTVTLPRAWNEAYAFRVPIEELPDDTVRYSKTFYAPKAWKGKKIFIEFEGARQSAEVWLNGKRVGLHQNGVMAFGFDLTPYIKIGKDNVLEVLTDNDWSYHEKNADGTEIKVRDGVVVKDGNNLPNNELKPTSFQWNNKNFNANYGGLPKNVRLHVVPKLYQTLPLFSTLGTTGVYVYAKGIDVEGHSATIHAESEVRNESGKAQNVIYEVEVIDRQTGNKIASFASNTYQIGIGITMTLSAEERVNGLHLWSWGYGYLYDVITRVRCLSNNTLTDQAVTTTGFRKTEFGNGQTKLNGRTIMMHGYAQRTSNEWPGVGMSVPAWLSDYCNRLIVESGGNLVRWMHVCPWKQDIESCDRVGLMQAMPAGDAEKDVTGRHWEQRTELMRDAIIYNRNNPSIIFYECGNKGISEAHMLEMKAIRDQYDPYGGRAIGSREMLNAETSAEYGGEMLYINKSGTKPVWAMEYCRDEALRRYWDDWSAPYHKQGAGPLYRNADASAYNQNNDQFAIEMVRRWYDYWQVRPGTGERVSNGGVKIVFSDTNTHNRGESNYRTSGVTDAMRIPKDAFYAHQVMWDGWVTPEQSRTHIIGHWNYEQNVVKPVFVVSDAPCVKLYLNGKEVGKENIDYHFLHTFDSIAYEPGTLTAVSFDAQGKKLSEHTLTTAGAPHALRIKNIDNHQMTADGADMCLLEYEVVDAEGRRCPLANDLVHFTVEGPAEWIGGIAYRDSVKSREEWEKNPNSIRSLSLPVECGVNRALIRSTGEEGSISITAKSESGMTTAIKLGAIKSQAPISGENIPYDKKSTGRNGNSTAEKNFVRGETPSSPSYTNIKHTIHPVKVVAGCHQTDAQKSIDNSEDTEWKNDGKASTAWIRYEFERPVRIDEISMKLTGWRQRSYPLEIFADRTLVWEGKTPQSLGYVHLAMANPTEASSIIIRLKGAATSDDAFGQITELVAPVANELDLFKAKDGDKVRSELRIVECDFLQNK